MANIFSSFMTVLLFSSIDMYYLHDRFDYIRGAPQVTELSQRIDWIIESMEKNKSTNNMLPITVKGRECLNIFNQKNNEYKFKCLADFTDTLLKNANSDFLRKYIIEYHSMPWYGYPYDIFVWHLYAYNSQYHKDMLNDAEQGLKLIVENFQSYHY